MSAPDRNCLVILQNRDDTKYNDFIGKFYHFPKKYLKLLSVEGSEFVYYEPKKKGDGVYFGFGRTGKVFPDRREADCYFCEIKGYKTFTDVVEFEGPDGKQRESGPTYNSQNAVRRISPEVLDGICLDGGIKLNFTADAHLLTVLGEQLISSEQVGILELVKNAYDAGATKCTVRIEGLDLLPPKTEEYYYSAFPGPVVVIQDNGRGMDRFAIEHGWLRPASTIKTDVKARLKQERQAAIEHGSLGTFNMLVKTLKAEHGGRLPLGEKGVGRFATHRLGRKVLITTKTADNDYEYVLSIDWDQFDSAALGRAIDLDSVGVALKRQSPTRDYGKTNSGTRIVAYSGRQEYPLSEDIVRKISRALHKLRSPSHAPGQFDVKFECPQVEHLEERPWPQIFPPIFSIVALVDEKGFADLELKFDPPKSVPLPAENPPPRKDFPLRSLEKDYWLLGPGSKEFRDPKCGAFYLRVDFWYRATPWIEGPDKTDFVKYLDTYGGISIFRDGLNIFPAEWGAEVDWLELTKRHIRSGDRLSYREMIGNLEIDQSSNLRLVDKTDRQGMINNEAYRDLSKLVRAIVLFVENEFQGKRERYNALTAGLTRDPKKLGDLSKQSSNLISNITRKYDVENDPLQLLIDFGTPTERAEKLVDLSRSLKNLQKSLKMMQEVQDLLAEQAGFGLAIAVSVHELAKITSNFYYSVSKLIRTKKLDEKELQKLQESSEALGSELKRLGPVRAVRNEKPKKFNIGEAIRYCAALSERRFEKSTITMDFEGGEDFPVFARFGAIVQVISNLIDNSCYWLDTTNERKRLIKIKVSAEDRTVLIADSGPGLDEAIRPYLFQPGYSLREPASGLGLYICKYYMRTAGGDAYEAHTAQTTDLPGAQFILDFGRVPKGDENE